MISIIHIVFSILVPRLTFLLASVNVSVYLCYHPADSHHQDKPEVVVLHSMLDPPGFPGPSKWYFLKQS
jgi:hypothetical protein